MHIVEFCMSSLELYWTKHGNTTLPPLHDESTSSQWCMSHRRIEVLKYVTILGAKGISNDIIAQEPAANI